MQDIENQLYSQIENSGFGSPFTGKDGWYYVPHPRLKDKWYRFASQADAEKDGSMAQAVDASLISRSVVSFDEALKQYPLSDQETTDEVHESYTVEIESDTDLNEEEGTNQEKGEEQPNQKKEITASDLLNRKVESIPCLIEPIIQRTGLVALAGSSDVGKSAFLRQLAWSIGTGEKDFLGWIIKAEHQSAIYVSSEDDENATAFLLHSLNKHKGKDPAECGGLRFVFETHDLLKELDRRLTARPADLVVIDAFGDLYTGDANKTNQIRQFLHDYSQLAQKHECLIIWLHHTGKRTDDEAPSKHNVIGGQGFEGKMRLLIELRRDHHDQSCRHLCIVKGNYLPDTYKDSSYVLNFENFVFNQTNERVAFDRLAKPKEEADEGRGRYEKIQKARQQGYKGDALATHLGCSKGYISQIEKKYGPKAEAE